MQENKDYIIKCPSSLKGLNNKVKIFCAGPIHGFFQALTSKKDELNAAGKMFVDCKVFTKEEIISMSKSSL